MSEQGWLIEGKIANSLPCWWSGRRDCREWTTDACLAVRFCRKQDAEAAAAYLGHGVATDHLWENPPDDYRSGEVAAISPSEEPTDGKPDERRHSGVVCDGLAGGATGRPGDTPSVPAGASAIEQAAVPAGAGVPSGCPECDWRERYRKAIDHIGSARDDQAILAILHERNSPEHALRVRKFAGRIRDLEFLVEAYKKNQSSLRHQIETWDDERRISDGLFKQAVEDMGTYIERLSAATKRAEEAERKLSSLQAEVERLKGELANVQKSALWNAVSRLSSELAEARRDAEEADSILLAVLHCSDRMTAICSANERLRKRYPNTAFTDPTFEEIYPSPSPAPESKGGDALDKLVELLAETFDDSGAGRDEIRECINRYLPAIRSHAPAAPAERHLGLTAQEWAEAAITGPPVTLWSQIEGMDKEPAQRALAAWFQSRQGKGEGA